MKKLPILIISIFFTLCIHAQENVQKNIIVAFDVTKSMQCPDANKDISKLDSTENDYNKKKNHTGNKYILDKTENPFYEPEKIWGPALEDLKSIVENADEKDNVIILPFQKKVFKPIKSKTWDDVHEKLCDYGKNGGNTCLLTVWESAEEYMNNGNFEFYFITDGDEDHDNKPDIINDDEGEHTSCVISKIKSFKNKYKINKGYAYYSLLTTSGKKSKIHEELNNTDYFKMKVPGTWGKTEISCDWMSLPYSCYMKFTPIGSLADEKDLYIRIEASCDDKYFDVSDLTFKNNVLKFNIKKAKDTIVNWTKDREGKEYYKFMVRLHTPWSDSNKYFIYDKDLTICINRPRPEKVEVQDTVRWQFDDEKLDSISKVIDIISPDGMRFNMDNLVVDCNDGIDDSNKPNISLSLANNQIIGGKAKFSIDTTKLKDIHSWDGKYYYTFTIKSNGKSVRQVEPFEVKCEISFLNTKSIRFKTTKTQPIKYYKKRAWKESFSDTISCEVTYELSDFVSMNCNRYKDIQISFHGEEPIIVNSNIMQPIQDANNYVSFCLSPESEKLSGNKIFSTKYDSVTVEMSNLNGIDKVFWNGKSYEVEDGGCVIEDALVIEMDRVMNPLFRTLLILLLVLFAAIIILLLKRLKDRWERNRKPKFCGDSLGLHFRWTGRVNTPNIDLQYNEEDGPYLPSLLANASYIHTYLLSKECVEQIVLVSGKTQKHEKPHGSCGWTLYVSADFQNYRCNGGVIGSIVIRPQANRDVEVEVRNMRDVVLNAFHLNMNMNNNNPYARINNMFDEQAIELEVYPFIHN